jgi:hypothetical protein
MNYYDFYEIVNSSEQFKCIKNSFLTSKFILDDKNISSLVKNIIDTYEYSNLSYNQTGILLINKKQTKPSYIKEFDEMIKKLCGVYIFEFVKFISYRINIIKILNLIYDDMIISDNKMKYKNLFKLFIKLLKYTNINYKNIFTELKNIGFQSEFKSFGDFIKILIQHIDEIQNFDIVSNKFEVNKIIKIILNNIEGIKDINIKTIDELVLDIEQYNRVYDGSFINSAHKIYEKIKENDYFDSEFTTSIKQSIINKLVELIQEIKKIKPDLILECDNGLLNDISDSITSKLILVGYVIAKNYDNNLKFDKISRIQFKSIYIGILDSEVNFDVFTDSQKQFIFYILLSADKIKQSEEVYNEKIGSNE